MNPDLILNNLLNPPILFFLLGLLAVLIRSDLEIPQPAASFLSLYLLLAIGFKGGVELGHSVLGREVILGLALAVTLAVVVPIYSFFILKRRLDLCNAGAVAATYGSVSAVTFVTAVAFLQDRGEPFGGHMVAALALMESPAIVVSVVLIRIFDRSENANGERSSLMPVLKEAVTSGSVVMIVGALIVGMLAREQGVADLKPFTDDLFKGVLSVFLLDMGLLAGKRLRALRQAGSFLLAFAILTPLLNAGVTIVLGWLVALPAGDTMLLTVLAAGASYIAVPAAMRMVVPEANPGLYVPMSLAITFPFNIILGIPLYYSVIEALYAP